MDEDTGRSGVAVGLSSLRGEAAKASSPKASIPNANDFARSWLVSMTKQGEDNVWRGAQKALAVYDGMRSQLAYLREHHHITESMIGIMLLGATEKQNKAVQHYNDQLDLLHINRLLDLGVPVENIGSHGIFVEPDHLVAQAIEARGAETGTGSVHESAVAKPCAQGDAS